MLKLCLKGKEESYPAGRSAVSSYLVRGAVDPLQIGPEKAPEPHPAGHSHLRQELRRPVRIITGTTMANAKTRIFHVRVRFISIHTVVQNIFLEKEISFIENYCRQN